MSAKTIQHHALLDGARHTRRHSSVLRTSDPCAEGHGFNSTRILGLNYFLYENDILNTTAVFKMGSFSNGFLWETIEKMLATTSGDDMERATVSNARGQL